MVPDSPALLFWPSPLVRLACGSMSTTRTFWPGLASDAARLIVVVVLPTPPFWLATARSRLIRLIDQLTRVCDWFVGRRIENRGGRVNTNCQVLGLGIRGSGSGGGLGECS